MKATATSEQIQEAARAIREGRLVVFPTETVYGLGADALNEGAVSRIYAAKERPPDNPLIVHLASIDRIPRVVRSLAPLASALFARFAPGPLTLVLPAHADLPRIVTAGLDTVAVRIPRHPVARAFLEACGGPVAAPSANRSGEPSPTTLDMARASLEHGAQPAAGPDAASRVALRGIRYLDGGPCEVGLESTVAAVTDHDIVILRPGAISASDLRDAAPGVAVREAGAHDEGGLTRSPGRVHRHYHPRATVVLHDPARENTDDLKALLGSVAGPGTAPVAVIGVGSSIDAPSAAARAWQAACCGVDGRDFDAVVTRRATDVAGYARDLYRWFTELDAAGAGCIVAVLPADHGIGRAVRDRLQRASTG